jgi:hypothetical protein
MPVLYVIVHPKCFDEVDLYNLIEAKRKKLDKIQKKFPFFVIDDFKNPSEIHEDMIPPHPNLEVRVCGAYYGGDDTWCVDEQFDSLKKTGYNVEIYEPACLKV